MLTAITHALLRRTVKNWFANDTDIEDTRRKLDRFVAITDHMPRGSVVTELGHAGSAILHTIAAPGLPPQAPTILYLHGGGYMVGSLTSHGAFCARLAKAVGGRVIFVEYRLAPEHPFPAAFEDCLAAWRMISDHQPGPIILAGDSAGGGLALAVAQACLAEALRFPDRLVLFSPWADMSFSGASTTLNESGDSMLSAEILARMRNNYIQNGEATDTRASPLLGPLTALPPTLIICSKSEVLRDDSRRLAEAMRTAGTQVSLSEFAGQPHVFPIFRILPAASRALAEVASFVA